MGNEINRQVFADIFQRVVERFDYELPEGGYEGEDFKIWDYDEEIYILHKPSGVLVNWYKFCHVGRTNSCNIKMHEEGYKGFVKTLMKELDVKLS